MKARELKVGDEVISRSDVVFGKMGVVTKLEDRFGGYDSVLDIYFNDARFPSRMHKTTEVKIKGITTSGKGFK